MSSFAIVCYNHRTYRSGGVVAVVEGRTAAERTLLEFEDSLSEKDRHADWRFFVEATDVAAGTEADEATRIRQEQLDKEDSSTNN
jgi:hypothetical protein